jgi:hypothetical protein
MLCSSRDSNVQNPAKLIEGFLKRDIAQIISQKFFENSDIHEVTLFSKPFEFSPERIFFLVGEGCEVILFSIEKILDGSGG